MYPIQQAGATSCNLLFPEVTYRWHFGICSIRICFSQCKQPFRLFPSNVHPLADLRPFLGNTRGSGHERDWKILERKDLMHKWMEDQWAPLPPISNKLKWNGLYYFYEFLSFFPEYLESNKRQYQANLMSDVLNSRMGKKPFTINTKQNFFLKHSKILGPHSTNTWRNAAYQRERNSQRRREYSANSCY